MVDFNKKIDRRGTYCTQWDYIEDRFSEKDLLPFTISDMDLESPKEIIEVLKKRVEHGVFGYSRWNHSDYKDAIKMWYKKRFGAEIDSEWIVYSPSVMYSVAKFINLFSEEEDGVLIFTPAYDAFYKTISANNRKVIESSLVLKEDKYLIDFDDFELKCKEAKVFLLCNPHNPTGRVWTYEELKKILKICNDNKVKIISDDIHMDITYERKTTPIFKLEGSLENIICSSPSKTFNIPALTGSYVIIPDKNLRNEFIKIIKDKEAVSSPSIFAVIATIVAYNKCEYWVDELVNHTKENINLVKNILEQDLKSLKLIEPDGCYFAWINFKDLNLSSKEFQVLLIQKGKVAIMPGNTYGKVGEYFIRLNVGCSREKVFKGLERIKAALE